MRIYRFGTLVVVLLLLSDISFGQNKGVLVQLSKRPGKKIEVKAGGKLFTVFSYPDSLEKPVLYPILNAGGAAITRGYPVDPQPGDPTDHPHHVGLWLNFENVNGLDFWNNSFAIPAAKKSSYGWIKMVGEPRLNSGNRGSLSYTAHWTNQSGEILLKEETRFVFAAAGNLRTIDRITTLTAVKDVLFTDAKDGLLGLRMAHALQIPTREDQKFADDKGNVTVVKGGTDTIPTGNYITSEGKMGNDAWSTRARWCRAFGKMHSDSVGVTIIDHPGNVNYPTFWHARGYGLFAANPLGEKIFTNGKSAKNLHLAPGESVSFRFRIVVENGARLLTVGRLNQIADEFARTQ